MLIKVDMDTLFADIYKIKVHSEGQRYTTTCAMLTAVDLNINLVITWLQ